MKNTSFVAAAVASLAVLALSANYEPAAAQKGGHGGGGGRGGSPGISSGGHVGGRVGGSPGIRSGGRALTGTAPRARAHVNRGGGRHVRHFRGGHVYGYAPFGYYGGDNAYAGSCGYYYRRALATGSSYWWRRYYDCIED